MMKINDKKENREKKWNKMRIGKGRWENWSFVNEKEKWKKKNRNKIKKEVKKKREEKKEKKRRFWRKWSKSKKNFMKIIQHERRRG